ncbi:MAG: hypothetical protein WAP35_09410 [Solirubrobacterales bacterium]
MPPPRPVDAASVTSAIDEIRDTCWRAARDGDVATVRRSVEEVINSKPRSHHGVALDMVSSLIAADQLDEALSLAEWVEGETIYALVDDDGNASSDAIRRHIDKLAAADEVLTTTGVLEVKRRGRPGLDTRALDAAQINHEARKIRITADGIELVRLRGGWKLDWYEVRGRCDLVRSESMAKAGGHSVIYERRELLFDTERGVFRIDVSRLNPGLEFPQLVERAVEERLTLRRGELVPLPSAELDRVRKLEAIGGWVLLGLIVCFLAAVVWIEFL